MISTDPPNNMIILAGFRATRRRLTAADFSPGISVPAANRRPGRVARTIPAIATTTARISSSLLLDGSLNALARPWPDQVKKTTSKTRCTMAPATLLTPTAATPALVSTPDFCRYRAFNAMPPTLAGETRLTNDEAA